MRGMEVEKGGVRDTSKEHYCTGLPVTTLCNRSVTEAEATFAVGP